MTKWKSKKNNNNVFVCVIHDYTVQCVYYSYKLLFLILRSNLSTSSPLGISPHVLLWVADVYNGT